MVTVDDVRALALTLPRSYEAHVRGRVKFRVGSIVFCSFSRDAPMGLAPQGMAEALSTASPDKFAAEAHDMRYHWAHEFAAIDEDEMRPRRERSMCVPKGVVAEHAARARLRRLTVPITPPLTAELIRASTVVVGAQGDEGKGKIVDCAALDVVSLPGRAQRRAHDRRRRDVQDPCLPQRRHSGKTSVIGAGRVVDPEVLIAELEGSRRGDDTSATVVVPGTRT